jgi:hypothetical protein
MGKQPSARRHASRRALTGLVGVVSALAVGVVVAGAMSGSSSPKQFGARQAAVATTQAPKVAAAPPAPLAGCPRSLGPLGAFTPAAQDFHYSDGLITGGVRALGSDGALYVIYGGIHVPVDRPVAGPMDSTAGTAGFFLVERYPSATVDPCQALNQGTTVKPASVHTIDDPQHAGAIVLGPAGGDVVTYSAPGRPSRHFNFVALTLLD